MNPVESHVILRTNEEMLSLLESTQRLELTPDLSSSEQPNRLFDLRLGDYSTKAILLDLPTITESQKTLDGINYFKVADICQLLYCIPRTELPDYRAKGTSLARMLERDSRYSLKSGLTPPTHNITSEFFKREVPESLASVREVEKRIKRAMEQKGSGNVLTQLLEFDDESQIPADFQHVVRADEEDQS